MLYGRLKENFLRQSEEALNLSRASGYGTAVAADRYVWGSILSVMSGAMAMIMNAELTGRELEERGFQVEFSDRIDGELFEISRTDLRTGTGG